MKTWNPTTFRVKFAVTRLRQQEEYALGAAFAVPSSGAEGAAFAASFST
jgi:hypothetical protein